MYYLFNKMKNVNYKKSGERLIPTAHLATLYFLTDEYLIEHTLGLSFKIIGVNF